MHIVYLAHVLFNKPPSSRISVKRIWDRDLCKNNTRRGFTSFLFVWLLFITHQECCNHCLCSRQTTILDVYGCLKTWTRCQRHRSVVMQSRWNSTTPIFNRSWVLQPADGYSDTLTYVRTRGYDGDKWTPEGRKERIETGAITHSFLHIPGEPTLWLARTHTPVWTDVGHA